MDEIRVRLYRRDCREAMRSMPEASVDSVVTDPPYGLKFMGKAWDHGVPGVPFWQEALRVLKPGGHLLAFGGTRTYHRMTVAIEDAGFEVRDCIAWMYGTGFPKSLDVSKAIDKAAGAERDPGEPGRYAARRPRGEVEAVNAYHDGVGNASSALVTAPATDEAREWEGWGTALKPAHEPIVVARKPLAGTVAANVLAHGTGALNIDATRVEAQGRPHISADGGGNALNAYGNGLHGSRRLGTFDQGRWPANVVMDPEAGAILDKQSGTSVSRIGKPRDAALGDGWGMTATGAEYDNKGGASRFFYTAKASKGERNAGLPEGTANNHPTVKPVALMRWLVRLVTPPGGTVLDPFAGSGTTGIAAVHEGMHALLVELEPAYHDIIAARVRQAKAEVAGAGAADEKAGEDA